MKVIVFGATGMLGQGVVIECLADPEVETVLVIGRSSCGVTDPKLRERVHPDLFDYSAIAPELQGYDACLFCLGVSSAGMSEADYHRVTYELTLAAAQALLKANPAMTFLYISGASTDSTEKGRSMWARVKGKTENALLKLGFKGAYMFRPAYIQPMKGLKSRTASYRVLYAIFGPLYPLLKLFPGFVTNTEKVGRAMLRVAKQGFSKPVLESSDINAVAEG
jgi:uncharacterized protein YbjT (DUF2867 family)